MLYFIKKTNKLQALFLPDSPAILPSATRNLFEKRFLDFQKLFINFSFVLLCGPLWLKN